MSDYDTLEAQGTKIYISDGASGFTQIKKVKSFNGPGGSASVTDVTDLDSVAKEKRLGLPDEGQLQLTINYVPAEPSHIALRAARVARTKTAFQMTFSDGTTWDFDAYVTSFPVQGAVDGVVESSVSLEITGAITETPAPVTP